MIVLDTNVVSALMAAVPEPAVKAWLDRQPSTSLWVTAITVFESRYGVESLPEGRRRQALENALERSLREDLGGRILPFDAGAAEAAAAIAGARKAMGRPIDFRDLQIAGIVASRGATLATRNMRHFRDLAVRTVDPWSADGG